MTWNEIKFLIDRGWVPARRLSWPVEQLTIRKSRFEDKYGNINGEYVLTEDDLSADDWELVDE